MRNFAKFVTASAIAVSCTLGPVITANAKVAEPVSLDAWALRSVIAAVEVSPDGKHILVLKTESREGEHVLEIYNVNDMSKPVKRLNADPMEFVSAQWVSNTHIFGTAWKVVRKKVSRPEEDVRSYKIYSYNLDSNKFSESSGSFSLAGMLPNEPTKVLVATGNAVGDGLGVDPFAAFRPRSYYKFDLETGRKSLILKGSEDFPTAQFDIDGYPRYTARQERGSNELVQFYRKPGDKSWTEFGKRYDLDEEENLYRVLSGFYGYAGSKADDPDVGYIIESFDNDKAALYEFNFASGQFGEKLFEAPDADVMGVRRHSNFWGGNNKVVGAVYSGAKLETHWFDAEEEALYAMISENIPYSHQVRITSRSRDGNSLVVSNSGPRDPGSFWFINNGQMSKLGSRNPLIDPKQLADVEFIKYKARDGLTIPAYVTKPQGEGPFPLIVLPHGGPHVNEIIGYDEWGQMLANNGYMVLQPQYRMSVGWGREHFDSAYGEHGLAMQDDKDDGALYLVEQGLVDPDRMAMFGWSYGGYAALVAASRDPNIYQCVIAGAAVADPEKVYNKRKSAYAPKALDAWSQRRGTIGINPMNEVDKVNVPIMMIHGDVDARVLYFNYKDYRKEIERVAETNQIGTCKGGIDDTECTTTLYHRTKGNADSVIPTSVTSKDGEAYTGKSRFVTLKGADHFSRTLMFDHQKKLYSEMLDFLKTDCGPGGL